MELNEYIFQLVKSCGVVANMMQKGIRNEGKDVDAIRGETKVHYEMRQAKTKVDEIVQEMLLQGLYPYLSKDVFLDVEEDTKTRECYPLKDGNYGLIIDPIDGTLPYIYQEDCYSICLGITYQNDFVLAIVYFPKSDVLYYHGNKSGCRYYPNASLTHFDEYQPLLLKPSHHRHVIVKNSRVHSSILDLFKDYTILDDSEPGLNCPKAILQCMDGKIDAYICDHRNLRDVLLAVIYSHVDGVYCVGEDG